MPILNYTTKIAAHRTIGEIQQTLARAGARGVSVEYDQLHQPAAVTFVVEVSGQYVNFRLPSRWQGVLKALEEDPKVPYRLTTEEQARRVAWRIVKDWIEAQMAIIEAQLAELPEVFLPYAVHPESGRTLFEEFKEKRMLPE